MKTYLLLLLSFCSLIFAQRTSVTLLSPNGGEVFTENTIMQIRWQDDLPENVKIELVKETQSILVITASVTSNGSYDWQIPVGVLESSNRYKIKVSSSIVPTINDLSDNYLIINATTPVGTQIAAGNVSGNWLKSNSPYYINGDITVPTGSALTIQPGVQIYFKGNYKFTVAGKITAVGTTTDKISFTAANTDVGWSGVFLAPAVQQTTDSSRFAYCNLSRVLNVSTISNNYSITVLTKAKVNISNCDLLNNSNAIKLDTGSKLTVTNSAFYNNTGYAAIYIGDNSALKVTNSLFYNNQGRAIEISTNSVGNITNCTIADNGQYGIKLYYGSTLNLVNSILWNNRGSSGYEVYSYDNTNILNIYNSIVQGGYWEFYLGGSTYNGYYTNNMETDPQFISTVNRNYRLKATSPAVNAGQNPAGLPQYDLDGNARVAYGQPDIGCYEFSSLKPVIYDQYALSTNEDQGFSILPASLKYIGGHYPGTYSTQILAGTNYTANGSMVTPAQNFNGQLTVSLKLYDGYNYSDPFNFLVTVNPVNDAPQINLPDTLKLVQGVTRIWDCTGFISDIDNTPENLTLAVSGNNQISAIVYGKKIIFAAPLGFTGNEKMTVQVNDQSSKTIAQDTVRVFVSGPSSIEENRELSTGLYGAYPNPFNNSTVINYQIAQAAPINLAVYNARGELVKTLFKGECQPGRYQAAFDATALNSGVYFYRLITPSGVNTSKVLLVK